jgi:hypothetical protein
MSPLETINNQQRMGMRTNAEIMPVAFFVGLTLRCSTVLWRKRAMWAAANQHEEVK